MPNTTMTYGSYSFSPVPLVTIGRGTIRQGDDTTILAQYNLTLNGVLIPPVTSQSGIVGVDIFQNELTAALSGENQLLEIKCGDSTLLQAYPKVINHSYPPSNNNWVFTSDYTIEMQWEETVAGGDNLYVTEVSEDWNFEFSEDQSFYQIYLSGVPAAKQTPGVDYDKWDTSPYVAKLTHNVGAKGLASVSGTLPGWKQAEQWVLGYIGLDASHVFGSGVINLSTGNIGLFDHVRTRQVNENAGTFNVSESWVVFDSGRITNDFHGLAIEDFTIDVRRGLDSNITNTSVNGTIQGLETRDYGNVDQQDFGATQFTIETGSTKYNNASKYWGSVQSKLLPRATYASHSTSDRALNITPTNRTIGHSFTNGFINYNYEYNDRPSNCITGALFESINITDNNPVDVFAVLPVLGRAAGPVLQDIGTKTERIRNLSIEVVMPLSTGCSYAHLYGASSTNPRNDVQDNIVCPMEAEISGAQDQVFVQNDNESWQPKNGRYSRNISWVFADCDDGGSLGACADNTNMDVI